MDEAQRLLSFLNIDKPTGYDDSPEEVDQEERAERNLRIRERNTDAIMEVVNREIAYIREDIRRAMSEINTLTRRERDILDMVTETVREAEEQNDDNQIRNAYGILRAQRQNIRDAFREVRLIEEHRTTLEQLNQFAMEEDPDEMERFAEYYNITLEIPDDF